MKEFFENVIRYPRYLISFSLGILYSAVQPLVLGHPLFTEVQPLVPLLQKPSTAIALIGAVVAGFLFLTFTLRAMLGLEGV